MSLEIKKAIIIHSTGTDKIILETDLPCQYSKQYMQSQPCLSLSFDAPNNMGEQYVKQHFGKDL